MGTSDQLVNFGSLPMWTRAVRLVTAGVRRRRLSIAAFALVFVVIGGTAGKLMPKSYSTQARMLVKKNYVMPALANPKRAVPSGSEAASQSAETAVMSRGSLEAIVSGNDLLSRWDRDRPAVLRFKDKLMGMVAGPMKDEDKRDVLVEVLAKRISVNVSDDIITFKASWTDKQTALDLTNAAVKAFLDSRRSLDVQTIADTYEILKRSAEQERAFADHQLVEVQDRQKTAVQTKLALPRRATAPAPAVTSTDDGLGAMREQIRSTHTALAAVEKRYTDQIGDLRSKLNERRSVLKATHPDIVSLEKALAGLQAEPAELTALRTRESRLLAEYASRGGHANPFVDQASGSAGAAARPMAAESDGPAALKDLEDDATVYARSLFKGSIETYQDLLARLKNTQIELETAEVAFRYRYAITKPAQLPKKADSPNVPMIVIGSLVAGLVAGVVRAIFKELQSLSLLSPSALGLYLSAPPAPSVAA